MPGDASAGRVRAIQWCTGKIGQMMTPENCDGTNPYLVDLVGEPSTKLTLEPVGSATGDPGYPGRMWTGMAVVNMIHDVIAAARASERIWTCRWGDPAACSVKAPPGPPVNRQI
jgi:hypothetical protein